MWGICFFLKCSNSAESSVDVVTAGTALCPFDDPHVHLWTIQALSDMNKLFLTWFNCVLNVGTLTEQCDWPS